MKLGTVAQIVILLISPEATFAKTPQWVGGTLFAALQSDVTSLQPYKTRLLQQNNNYQQVQTNNLFTSYNY
jgi:hypothetical protein